ncbi:serine hydrolase [Spirillospora sp. NPDC048911]|uniref:serine hydrolase n=1 Tax=Spirillospora sp. NPDC048911 TaxID=3364527 RepID=UPI003719CDE2
MVGTPLSRETRSAHLSKALRESIRAQRFEEIIDFGSDEIEYPVQGAPIRTMPFLDLAVIELNADDRPVAAANALLSPDYPDPVEVELDEDWGTSAVRWVRWDAAAWEAGTCGTEEAAGSTATAPYRFMSPYPACIHKLMVAFRVLRLVDEGILDLEATYSYQPEADDRPRGSCRPGTRTLHEWLDRMITISENQAGCALIKLLHDRGEIEAMHAELHDLGLRTLRLDGTNPRSGGRWQEGQITMTALDTARLLVIINGAPGTLWRRTSGGTVDGELLSADSRRLLVGLLLDQGYNEVLSTSNWFGADYPSQGIPHAVSRRWIAPEDGTVTMPDLAYGRDVRSGLKTAEVTFAHKIGQTFNTGADAGIVKSLPGKPERRYVVAVFSNLGIRFADPRFAGFTKLPAAFPGQVQFTEKFAGLGRSIDKALVAMSDR